MVVIIRDLRSFLFVLKSLYLFKVLGLVELNLRPRLGVLDASGFCDMLAWFISLIACGMQARDPRVDLVLMLACC